MKNQSSVKSLLIIGLVVFFVCCGIGSAEIYQYQDADGNWVFTDSPPELDAEKIMKMAAVVDSAEGVRDLEKELNDAYHPKNDVDAASMATVTVTSSIGTGSGFFISDKGHLLTNRHVIRGDERQARAADEAIATIDDQVDNAEEEFNLAGKQLAREKAIIDEMKAVIDKLSARSSQKDALEKQYQDRLAYYQAVKQDYERKQAEFKNQKRTYEKEKSDYENQQAVAGVSRNFKITLKNKEILYAYLVRTGSSHDLALLKVDGCKTPYIPAADINQVSQRQKVWAIGSPLNIADTMKDGTVSGFSSGFIQTNAQIYPGNSGGPLVNEKGEVIGINTFKELTRNFEGMGFAIPIDAALEEFAGELN